jgi:phosphatidylglycerophosphatase C
MRVDSSMDLPVITPHALVEKLDEELGRTAGRGRSLVAFDADGTLWSGDVGADIFDALVRVNGVRGEALGGLLVEAANFGVAVEGSPTEVAYTLDRSVALELYPEARALAMVAWAFAGWDPTDVEAFARKVVAETDVVGRIHPEVLPLLAWAREHDVEAWVVSASPRAIAVAGAALVGIPPERVLAMTPAIDAGRIAPRLEGPVTYAEGKRDALRAARQHAVVLGAFGDSGYDAALLREGRVPVAVHPKESLRAASASIPGLLLLGQEGAEARS